MFSDVAADPALEKSIDPGKNLKKYSNEETFLGNQLEIARQLLDQFSIVETSWSKEVNSS